MGRFWNLRTKLVGVLVLVLSGTFLLQSVIHDHNERHLLSELEKVTLDIANEAKDLVESSLLDSDLIAHGQVPGPSPQFIIIKHNDRGRSATSSARPPFGRERGTLRSAEIRLVLQRRFDPESVVTTEEARREQIESAVESLQGSIREVIRALRDPTVALPLEPIGAPFEFTPEFEEEIEFERSAIAEDGLRTAFAGGPSTVAPEAPQPTASIGFSAADATPSTIDVTPYFSRIQGLIDDSKRHDRIATIGVFLIGIALAWFLGVRVTRPVDEVIHGFQRLAAGDFEARVDERPGEEFGHLGSQFNAMVDRLREGRELERELSQRERVRHMGDLAAGVAHDVRNPLNAIHLNVDQIRDEFVPTDERGRERFLRFTADVQSEVERLNQLVTNFLSLAQPAAESAEPVEPNELIDELYRLMKKEATGHQVDLVLDLAESLPLLQWNRQEVKSAFLNIALNAIQAMRESGGHLEIATTLAESSDGRVLVVRFVDDGPGIPAEDLERVFVPYYTTREGGTGLGMAIARRTAERHGGRLELESTVGEGTTVTFRFPIAADSVGADSVEDADVFGEGGLA